ncbi:hypothetical protein XENOCAPTIV_008708, partial [Xenoophorus captivus]
LIEKRIGKENFVEKLGFITKHELYSRAALKPQPVFPSPEQMLFDHEFTRLVKELEGKENQSQSNNQGDTQVNGLQTEELSQLREQLEELRRQQTLLQTQLSEKDAVIDSLVSNMSENMVALGFHSAD